MPIFPSPPPTPISRYYLFELKIIIPIGQRHQQLMQKDTDIDCLLFRTTLEYGRDQQQYPVDVVDVVLREVVLFKRVDQFDELSAE